MQPLTLMGQGGLISLLSERMRTPVLSCMLNLPVPYLEKTTRLPSMCAGRALACMMDNCGEPSTRQAQGEQAGKGQASGRQHLLSKAGGCYEFEGLHLAEVRGIAQHVDVHELGHIPVPESGVLLLERISQGSAFLGNDSPLLRCRLAFPNATDELPADNMKGWTEVQVKALTEG